MIKAQTLLAIAAALLVTDALGYFGIFRWLGAHPFWDVKVAVIGSGIGVALGLALRWINWPGWPIGAAVLAVAAIVAVVGKSRFAASYAEDAFAGKMWYFGWIGIAIGLSLLIFSVIARNRR